MAYNPYFYQPGYPLHIPPTTQTNSITWVQGIEGAKAYPVAAGNSVLLMDSDKQYMYIKTADSAGMPSLKVYEYTEVSTTAEAQVNLDDYVTKKELEEALSKIKAKKRKVVEVEVDE